MDISILIINVAQSIGLPVHIMFLIPIAFVLAFHIMKSAEGKKQLAIATKCDNEKPSTQKQSTIAMLASLFFVVYSLLVLNESVNNHGDVMAIFTNFNFN